MARACVEGSIPSPAELRKGELRRKFLRLMEHKISVLEKTGSVWVCGLGEKFLQIVLPHSGMGVRAMAKGLF